jgi:hypothetical protein
METMPNAYRLNNGNVEQYRCDDGFSYTWKDCGPYAKVSSKSGGRYAKHSLIGYLKPTTKRDDGTVAAKPIGWDVEAYESGVMLD